MKHVLHFLSVFLVLLVLSAPIPAARILAIFPIPSFSHHVVVRPIWRELSLRGHQVTLLTTDPMRDTTLTNLTEIDLSAAYEIWSRYNITGIVNDNASMLDLWQLFMQMMDETLEYELSHPDVRQLIHGDSQFDLVMVEYIQPTMFAFVHRFKTPFIGITTLECPGMSHEMLGNPSHPVLYPDFTLPLIPPLTFKERVSSIALYLFQIIFFRMRMSDQNDLVRKHFGEGYPSLWDLRRDVDMMFINANPSLVPARPVTPATIYIGGGIHLTAPKALPKDIQTYLDDAKEGVIYFSLGSNIKSKDIPEKTRKVIIETLKELPYKVLWKFEAENLEGKPDNVKIMKWIPQQDVLRHRNVKVFITQGGLQSTEEALFNNVPLVVMPFIGDQEMNARRIEMKGFGLGVVYKNLEKEAFKKTILEVITNDSYKQRAKELATLALDEPMTGLEKAVWWTEYVIRNKGAKHLKGPAMELPLYQYYLLDVIGFMFAIGRSISPLLLRVIQNCKIRRMQNMSEKKY